MFDKIIIFFGDHYELLIYVNGSLILLFFLVVIAVKLREPEILNLVHSTIRSILFSALIFGQVALIAILGFLYWKNYQIPAPPLALSDEIRATTHWVNSDITIFYIDGYVLSSIKINGQNEREVFKSDSPINEYHFSPNGRYIIIATQKDLFLVHRPSGTYELIDSLEQQNSNLSQEESSSVKGTISNIRWSPDSLRFCYELSRWSRYSSLDQFFVYSIPEKSIQSIKSPTRRISSPYWDEDGNHIYYVRHETGDPAIDPSSFQVKVFRIPMNSLTPELVARIPFDKRSPPLEHLNFRDINLYLGGSDLSFSLSKKDELFISENGSTIGIDDEDYMYYINANWFRQRLFKVPREKVIGDLARYQYKGGDLVVDYIRWIPGGHYVIMEHKHWGVMILEPETRRIGVLVEASGRAFGWYHKTQP